MIHRRSTVRGFLALAALVALLGPVAVAQRPREPEPKMPIERLLKNLDGVGAHFRNAKVKLRGGMAGISRGGEDERKQPTTPAEACCSSNLERVGEKLQGLTRTTEHLYLYYTDRRDSEALAVVETIRAELHAVSRGFAAFRMEKTLDGAQQALLGIIRPFNRLRAAIEQLQACCPVDPAVWAEPSRGPRRP